MAGRYDRWRRLRGDKDHPDLVKMGEKLLGYLAEQRRVSGVKSQVIQRVMPDGSVVRAQFVRDQPLVEISTSPVKLPELPTDVDGFVTWPTDSAGALAIPDSPRVVVAGPQYRAVHKTRYSSLFPDIVDDELGECDGLGRAGNIDWQGKRNGWIVSWYGPRTRYMDGGAVRTPFVFFKGAELIDARDYVDIDAKILGAAVTDEFGGPWLIFVVEEFFFARYERVCAVKLVGKPTDARITVDASSYVELEARNPDDYNFAQHPWFFNPAGTEGRMLTEGDTFDSTAILEHVIRLVASGDPPGFAVERETIEHTIASSVESYGFDTATYGILAGKVNNQRAVPFAIGTGLPSGSTAGYPEGTVITNTGTFALETGAGIYQASTNGLLEYQYRRIVECAEDWQPIAVDYARDGTVVYAYGRHVSVSSQRTGGIEPEGAGVPEFSPSFTDNSYTTSATVMGGVWVYGISYNEGVTFSASVIETRAWGDETDTTTLGGIRIGGAGGPEITYGRTRDYTVETHWAWASPAFSSSTPTGHGGVLDPATPADFRSDVDGTGRGSNSTLHTSTVSSRRATEQDFFLARMDLRYNALFAVVEEVETTSDSTVEMDYDFSINTGTRPGGAGTTTSQDVRTKKYRTLGWIDGVSVLDDLVVTADNSADPPVELATLPPAWGSSPGYTAPLTFCSWYDDYASEAHSNGFGIWPWPTDDAFAYGRDAVGDYVIGDTTVPYTYTPQVTWPLETSINYAVINTESPVIAQLISTWQGEVEAGPGSNVGYTFGDIGNGRAKIRWKRDLDDIGDAGGWGFLNTRWAVSMALPSLEAEAAPFRFFSKCGGLDLAQHVLEGDETAEHFYPIWVLGTTRGFVPK